MAAEVKRIRVTLEGADVKDASELVVRSRAGRRRPPAELGDSRARWTASRSIERGFVGSTSSCGTDEPSIFAIGDVVGEPMLAHKASHEGRVAVEVIAGENVAFEPRAIPAVVFTDPELAWCGLTETQAPKETQRRRREVSVGRIGPRDHPGPDRRPDEADPRSGDRAHAWCRHRRLRRRRADRAKACSRLRWARPRPT